MSFTQEELAQIVQQEQAEYAQSSRPNIFAHKKVYAKYTCTACRQGFNKPKDYASISLIIELAVFFLSTFVFFLLFGVVGLIASFLLMCLLSIIKMCTSFKGCPYCKSKTFYQNQF